MRRVARLTAGQYRDHPFTVPPEVNRLDVATVQQGEAATGLGIFDQRPQRCSWVQGCSVVG